MTGDRTEAIEAFRRVAGCSGIHFYGQTVAEALHGRGFLPGEDKPGAEPVALIGYDLWQEEFGGSLTAVGAVIRLDGRPRTVVGIVPEGFKFPINDGLWIPAEPGQMPGWGLVFGRLKPSVSIAEARTELNVIAERLSRQGGKDEIPSQSKVAVGPFTRFDEMKGAYGPAPAVVAMLVVTLLVLFIACANVAGLTLANAPKRATELAVRGALGARRGRLVCQILAENLILTVSGVTSGLLVLNQRTREIGVRLALGATRNSIICTFLARAFRQVGAGLSVGSIVAWALNRMLLHNIAGYPSADSPGVIWFGTIAFLASVGMVAVLIPAVRGAKVDPMTALRYE